MFLVPKTFTSHPAAMEVKVPEVLAKDMNFLGFQVPILYPDLIGDLVVSISLPLIPLHRCIKWRR
jgi:hypothetical protein